MPKKLVYVFERIKVGLIKITTNIQWSWLQNEEQNQKKIVKIAEDVEAMKKTLTAMVTEIESGAKGSQAAYTIQESPFEAIISTRLDKISASLDATEETTRSLKETEKMVKNIEHKLKHGGGGSNEELERQSHILGNILNLATQTTEAIKKLPDKFEIQEMINGTSDKIDEINEGLIGNGDQGVAKILMHLDEKIATLVTGQEDLMKTTTDVQSMAEGFNEGVSQSYDQLLKEVKGLAKVEQVMIQTADNVMDTKRRIEYGVHQILLEVKNHIAVYVSVFSFPSGRRSRQTPREITQRHGQQKIR